jgi:urease accessory protein
MSPSEAIRSARASTATLHFEQVGGRTVVTRCHATSPLKILHPKYAGNSVWVCSSSHGGGLLSGDKVDIAIHVGAQARAVLTTQASTKIYRGENEARQGLKAKIASDALLAVAPDPIVCYRGSRYSQVQEFDLEPSSHLFVMDWFTSGRTGNGERWLFDSYRSRMLIRCGGTLTFWDATQLDEKAGAIAQRMGRFNVAGLVVIMGSRFGAGVKKISGMIADLAPERRSSLVVSTGPIEPGGLILRFAAETHEEAQTFLQHRLSFIWDELGDDPWARRY